MNHIIFKSAYLSSGWADFVKVTFDEQGIITSIEKNVDSVGHVVSGYALPGMNNIHSHAFQRAMAGLAEYSTSPSDSFWTWRDVMYKLANVITPDDLLAIASQLYVEMLKAGYVSVSEFHYLHRQGTDSLEMSQAIIEAAKKTNISLCHLPVLYMSSGFGGAPLNEGQKRFNHTVDEFHNLLGSLESIMAGHNNQRLGMAFHSLRAVPEAALKDCLARSTADGPIHIHISEQQQEVNDCLSFTGKRPVEWLCDNVDVDENWCLIHATHINDNEIDQITNSGAVVGICPTTEANLGDGIFPLGKYLRNGGKIAIGSDSHISVSVIEELRLLEYGQRLIHQKRNISVDDDEIHTGANLYRKALQGSVNVSGFDNGAIEIGKRADIIVLDEQSPLLQGGGKRNVIDQFIFSGNSTPIKEVFVAGRNVISNYKHQNEDQIVQRYKAVMKRIQKTLD